MAAKRDIHTADITLKEDLNCSEITELLEILKQEGHCYIKNQMLMLLCGAKGGELLDWHKNVTVPNMETLMKLCNDCGLPIPFPMDIKEREKELRANSSDISDQLSTLMSEGECLIDIKQAGQNLQHCYTNALLLSTNQNLRKILTTCKNRGSENYGKLLQAISRTEFFYSAPTAKKVQMMFNVKPMSLAAETE